jgi:hypothetical protein
LPQKPSRPAHSAKNVEGDFGKFTNFMKRLVAVPHSEIKAKLDAEKRAKARKSKRTSASRHFSSELIPGGYSEVRLACPQGKSWQRNQRFQSQDLGFGL